jgi:ribonuclease E/ribonuclease G
MTAVTLTCDRQDGLERVAVWQGKTLRDIYMDDERRPDFTGAIVGAKVARLMAGGKAAWCEAGLPSAIYVENPGKVRSGDILALRIVTTTQKDKAWRGAVAEGPVGGLRTGILQPPPRPWERALADMKGQKPSSLVFADRDELAACKKWLEAHDPSLLHAVRPLATEPPHPELDEIIESLTRAAVALPGGGDIVIESTQALVAIDVNGGDNANALAVNLQAVKEAARQVRWRNLSGIVMVDTLKMKARPDSAKVVNAAKRAVADDPADVQIFGMTKLGLLEMTRQRRWPSVQEIMDRR